MAASAQSPPPRASFLVRTGLHPPQLRAVHPPRPDLHDGNPVRSRARELDLR